MARLVIYVPFRRSVKSDLTDILAALGGGGSSPTYHQAITSTGNNIQIDEIVVLYAGEENHQVRPGDVLLVNAHGGDGRYTKLTDNKSGEITMDALMPGLDTIGAGSATEAIFYCCFSAVGGHIAERYKTAYPRQHVYGSLVACGGGQFFTHIGGRTGNETLKFRGAVWTDYSGLREMV